MEWYEIFHKWETGKKIQQIKGKHIIQNGITKIDDYAFAHCNSLVNITISNSVTTIDDYAFENCTSLNHTSVSNDTIKIGNYDLDDCYSLKNRTASNDFIDICPVRFWDI